MKKLLVLSFLAFFASLTTLKSNLPDLSEIRRIRIQNQHGYINIDVQDNRAGIPAVYNCLPKLKIIEQKYSKKFQTLYVTIYEESMDDFEPCMENQPGIMYVSNQHKHYRPNQQH